MSSSTYFRLGERSGSARHRFQGHGLTVTNPYPVRRPVVPTADGHDCDGAEGRDSSLFRLDGTNNATAVTADQRQREPEVDRGNDGASPLVKPQEKTEDAIVRTNQRRLRDTIYGSNPVVAMSSLCGDTSSSNLRAGTATSTEMLSMVSRSSPLIQDCSNALNTAIGSTRATVRAASQLCPDVSSRGPTASKKITLCDPLFDDVTDNHLWKNDDNSNAGVIASECISDVTKTTDGEPKMKVSGLRRPSSGEYLTRLYQLRNIGGSQASPAPGFGSSLSFRNASADSTRRRSASSPLLPLQSTAEAYEEDSMDAGTWDVLASAIPTGEKTRDPFVEEMWLFEREQIREAARRAANPPPPPSQQRRHSRKPSTAGEGSPTPERSLRFRDRECESLRGKLAHLLSQEVSAFPEITLSVFDDCQEGEHSFAERARLLSLAGSTSTRLGVSSLGGSGYDSDFSGQPSLQRRIIQSHRSNSRGGAVASGAAGFSMNDFAEVFGLKRSTITDELDTNIPVQDLHLLQLYCHNTDTVIIYRPVSDVVPDLYAGDYFLPSAYCDPVSGVPKTLDEIDPDMTLNELLKLTSRECRVKGKGIGVSLKSSPYPPIEGLIPINPNLSKTYSDARKKERALEDQLMRTRAGCISTALLRKIRLQRSVFGAATSVAVREIHASVDESSRRLEHLLAEYRAASAYARDKLAISLDYLDRLNESQFLGKRVARWRGLQLFYRRSPTDINDVERSDQGHPQFYCKSHDGLHFFPYHHHLNEIDSVPLKPEASQYLHPVEVLTHRSFVISDVSHRIEPDPQGDFLIGPDFDGFAYAKRNRWDLSVEEYFKACESRTKTTLLPTFGLVSHEDVEHVLDMRRLTQWKQSHGYECSNTVKTQDVGEGNYTVITPTDLLIATNLYELMEVVGVMWKQGFPLLLNPNWKVMLHPTTLMPVVVGDDVSTPIIDDCGLAFLKYQLAEIGKSIDDIKLDAYKYIEESAIAKRLGQRNRFVGLALIPRAALVLAKKMIADKFFAVRKWSLMPPMVAPLPPDQLAKKLGDRLENFMEKMASKKLNPSRDAPSRLEDSEDDLLQGESPRGVKNLSGSKGNFGSGTIMTKKDPISREFELYRDQRVKLLVEQFLEDCAVFEGIFGADEAKFTRRLKFYLDHDSVLSASAAEHHQHHHHQGVESTQPSDKRPDPVSSSLRPPRSDVQASGAQLGVSFLAAPKLQREVF